jgi:hypothetical protein
MTSTPTPIPEVCPELGLEVPVSQIDKELRKLWEQDEARTNASLMNLVVYSEKHGALLENSAIIRELTREHACRAILVEIDKDEAVPSIRAWVTAHCHLAHGLKSVCCEQIALFLTGRVTGRFRNTVFAHLNSDLPLVFWWQGELSDILTERLVSVVDRLIVDSSTWKNPAASFQRIEENARNNPDLILQDHAWTRTWQFRLGVASIFDDAAAQRALPDLDTVEIRYHPAHRNSAFHRAGGGLLRPGAILPGPACWKPLRARLTEKRSLAGGTKRRSPGIQRLIALPRGSFRPRTTRRPPTRPWRQELVVLQNPPAFPRDAGEVR